MSTREVPVSRLRAAYNSYRDVQPKLNHPLVLELGRPTANSPPRASLLPIPAVHSLQGKYGLAVVREFVCNPMRRQVCNLLRGTPEIAGRRQWGQAAAPSDGCTLLATAWIVPAISRLVRRAEHAHAPLPAKPTRDGGSAGAFAITEIDMLAHAYDGMVQALERLRQDLVRTSKMAMPGELAAVLSPGGAELMAFIDSETERLSRLVSTMLENARPGPPASAASDIHDLLRRYAQTHDLRRGASSLSHPTRLNLVAARHAALVDTEQLMQLVFNMLNNAAVAIARPGSVELSKFDAPGRPCIACSDDGPGITPELAERMFDPFVSGRDRGITLGLAVDRQGVMAHRGEIRAGRSQWGGAAIVVRLSTSSLAP